MMERYFFLYPKALSLLQVITTSYIQLHVIQNLDFRHMYDGENKIFPTRPNAFHKFPSLDA